jgi:hypothetical protein
MTQYTVPALLLLGLATLPLHGCDGDTDNTLLPPVDTESRTPVTDERIGNLEAPIPPQCYTKTEAEHNPCYTCHQNYDRDKAARMNQLDDGHLQGGYLFSDVGVTNHWDNLFVDRRDWQASISDEQILTYINQDNYSDLAPRLEKQGWEGFTPDLDNYHLAAGAFDKQGLARDGSHWVAFNYKPFPGTFWPTNGSTDDVVIRLPAAFREIDGSYQRELYLLNLTLLEMAIKQHESMSIPATDETRLNTDLNGDGRVSGIARTLKKRQHYLGDARNIEIAFQQYPQGAELMHTVRYVGIDEHDVIGVPPRMKELRYMRKIRALENHDVRSRYDRERKDKHRGLLPTFVNLHEKGMENGMGWVMQGFIEDYDGRLRPQSHEENLFCMGCHAAVGVTIDQTFALARKVDGAEGWGYIDLQGMPDAANISEPGGEIRNYLKRAGGGSEFRENPEMVDKWYRADGSLNEEAIANADVYTLITPSRERALKLNKAYTHIVRHQSYIHGRDATWLPARNVFTEVDESEPPLPAEFRFFQWDLRMDWQPPRDQEKLARHP